MSKVKICGLSRINDIEAVNRVLPDFIGFVFAPSRRRVEISAASILKEKLDPRIKAVGVFVNEDTETTAEIFRNGIIDMVQLHGDEDDAYIKRLKDKCGCPVIKAIGIDDADGNVLPHTGFQRPDLPSEPDFLLFDTLSGQRGGTGRSFDWKILKEHRGLQFFLSGGLSIGNVAAAIQLLDPFCVDVSSGVETNGIKDTKKIEEFISLVRRT